jgi:MoaA/NifB/PqqE/SkfB family radical SAM enzyme
MDELLEVTTSKISEGHVGDGGRLGYRDYTVSLGQEYADWDVLGAHADSELSVIVYEPVILCGGLNGTSMSHDRSPRVRFFINGIPFGESDYPQKMTDKIVLPRGQYILAAKLVEQAPDIRHVGHIDGQYDNLAHSVWCYKQGQVLSHRKNTLFVSAAAFGPHTEERTRLWVRSAEAMGIPYELYDTGQEYTTYFDHKIKHFLDNLYVWKRRGVEYIWLLDSRDIVFRQPFEMIAGKFNAMYDGRVIVGRDLGGNVHPLYIHNHWIAGELQKIVGRDCEINTGCLCGHVDDLIKVHENILQIRKEYLSGIARNALLAKLYEHQKHHKPEYRYQTENDDQALHCINFIDHPDWYQLDSQKVLHAMIQDFPGHPKMGDSPYKRDSICSAPILHGSRPASRGQWERMCKKRWWEEDERKRHDIPVQIPGLEINVVYACNLQCEYCAHMSRWLKGQVPYKELEDWINIWRDRLLPNEVRILGGEPFLHDHLDWVLHAVHRAWPEAARQVITNGLVESYHPNFMTAIAETGTDIHCSIHYNTVKYLEIADANIKKWQNAGIRVFRRDHAYQHWGKVYQLIGNIPLPYNSDPAAAWDACPTQRNCMTLLDNKLWQCPQAAFFQKAYQEGFLNEAWSLANDYQPLLPTCTWRELVRFAEDRTESSLCRLCADKEIRAAIQEKANLKARPDNFYLAEIVNSPVPTVNPTK